MSDSESTQSIDSLGLPLVVLGVLNLFVGVMAYGPRLGAVAHAGGGAVEAQVVAMGAVAIASPVLCIACGVLAKLWVSDARLGIYRVITIVAVVLEVAAIVVTYIASAAPFGLVAHILCLAVLATAIHLTLK